MTYINPREQTVMREAVRKANLPKNKYNFPLLHDVEVLTGEPSDRTAYDVGIEPERDYEVTTTTM